MGDDYRQYPRPTSAYYEDRHEFVTQGDIFVDVPWSQLGPEVIIVDPPPEGLPVPAGHLPALAYVWTTHYAMVLSDTCDFRHPSADDILKEPQKYRTPDSIYHCGYIRVAPIFPLNEAQSIPSDNDVQSRIRTYDHFRRWMYLPAMHSADDVELMPESAVAIHMTDVVHVDMLRRLERLCQLTFVARQQLNHKLVYADTGYLVPYQNFEPDLS